jgi:hypothetical protein
LKILIFIFFDLIVFTSEGKVKPGIPFFQGNRPVNLFRKPAIPFVLFIKITDDTVFPALSDFEKAIVLRYDFVVLVRYGQLFVDHDTVFPVLPFDPALVEMVVVAFCKCKSYTQ